MATTEEVKPTKTDDAKASALGVKSADKKSYAPGTDPRPPAPVVHQDLNVSMPTNPVYDKVEKGKLGDGGPSSNAEGVNKGNMHAEEEQHPSQNATAGGPDVGTTPANAPGMSHA